MTRLGDFLKFLVENVPPDIVPNIFGDLRVYILKKIKGDVK